MSLHEQCIHLKNGKLAADTPFEHVSSLVSRAVEHGNIVLHFHGGLVSRDTALENAARLSSSYTKGKAYPVFFIWESGIPEILRNNLDEICSEEFFRHLWKLLLKVVFRKLSKVEGIRGPVSLTDTPESSILTASVDEALGSQNPSLLKSFTVDKKISELSDFERLSLEQELYLDYQLVSEIQKISQTLRTPEAIEQEKKERGFHVRASTVTLIDPDALDRFITRPSSGEKGLIETGKMIQAIAALAARTVSRFVNKRDHGLHATIVEEILRELYLSNAGKFIWDLMKKDTADAFGDNEKIFGGSAFLSEIAAKSDPAAPPRITVVGHSTGAIYIAEFLDKAAELLPDQHFEIIFLAPAATFAKITGSIERHKHRIDSFRMFTMQDKLEKADRLVPFLYPHSLLYFISGVLENGYDVPVIGMQRFFNRRLFPDRRFPELTVARNFINSTPGGVVWSVTKSDSLAGMKSASLKHGDFDNDKKTLKSIEHLLKKGFSNGS
ncbi:MAG: hypothetical protein C1941_00275 [Prosthecochloris sp.]|nr:hypothetical protein [Prosthecochloris sp.]